MMWCDAIIVTLYYYFASQYCTDLKIQRTALDHTVSNIYIIIALHCIIIYI